LELALPIGGSYQNRTVSPSEFSLLDQVARSARRRFNLLRLPDVPGKPLLKDAAVIGSANCGVRSSVVVDGNRMIAKSFLLVPKKNSKNDKWRGANAPRRC